MSAPLKKADNIQEPSRQMLVDTKLSLSAQIHQYLYENKHFLDDLD